MLTTAEFHIGDSGVVNEVRGEVEHQERVVDSRIEDGRLIFRTEQAGGTMMRYEMLVESDGLALLELPDEPNSIKPFHLKKV